ncbi:MAG: hypothetical protein J2P40_11995 [Candidatus Dormibacteraeota bacterium]|nr:hypothetical protein [Candidatus Dormibacteraeota bacterium]MBO0761987.1 hypothetical protein [Candidatus Dormibacteraeota bacterium]
MAARSEPPALLRRWEELKTGKQIAISAPIFLVIFFVLNQFPFNQPLVRSIAYAIIEAPFFVAIAVWATHAERAKRLAPTNQKDGPEDDDWLDE